MPYPWLLYARRETLEQLEGAGLRGLQSCPVDVRFRGKNPPELLQLQPEVHGRYHADCFPLHLKPPCPSCGTDDLRLPDTYWLEGASLPEHLDMFRPLRGPTFIFVTERFVETAQRLSLDGVTFREVEPR
jgi:uncharacterized double-CXXCG motif protein